MAIPILNHLDFQKTAEIRNVKLHTAAEGDISNPGTGQIIYDSGTVKVYNGTSWFAVAVGAAGEENQNAFTSIAVSGQSTVVADAKTDTLTLAAGNKVAITTNTSTDTVTIAASDATSSEVVSALLSATAIDAVDLQTIQGNLSVDPSGTDNSTDVTLNTSSYNYLSISGQAITLGAIDYSTDVINKPSIPSAANNATITISAGDGLQTGGDFTTNQSANETITIDVDGTVVRTSGTQSIGGDKTFSNNVVVTGNLTVNGTTTTVNSNEVNIGDSIIVLNFDEAGTPSQDGGIEIERGTSDNAKWVWDEGNDKWTAYTNNGTTDSLAAVQASTFTGDLTGNVTGNASTATKLATARSISLSGDVSGSASFDGSANISITATVADDSHAHIISNVDGLQTALDAKAPLASPALTGTPTAPSAAGTTDSTQIATTAFTQDAIDTRTYVTTVGGATSIAVTHNLGTRDVIVQLYELSTYNTVFADVARTSTSQVTLGFASAPSASSIRVLVSKIV